jgi:glycosyltransferase involved in cell wall biosynthesis
MINQPPVSVYVITYLTSEERCDILRRTCTDLLALRYPDFEVVVSDNGGTISAEDALSAIEDARLKVFLNDANEGFTGNINRCVKYCSHDIIKPMCDDDLVHPDFLTQTVPLVDDETLVMVDVQKYPMGSPPTLVKQRLADSPDFEARPPGYDKKMWHLSYKSSCIPSAIIFTRKFFSRLGGYDPETATSDLDFLMEACLHGRVVHVKRKLCFVAVWPGCITEEELAINPYYFVHAALYTKLRIYHCKKLRALERTGLLLMLYRDCLVQGSRVLKHMGNPNYHNGYKRFVKEFIRLLRQRPGDFKSRPCDAG